MKKILIITLFINLNLSKIIHKCLHSQIIKNIPKLKIRETKKKTKKLGRNLENIWRPINILFDFSNIISQDPKKSIYIKTIIKLLKIKLEKIIMVQGEGIILSFNNACDNTIKVEKTYEKDINSDLIIFLDFSLTLNTLATAIPCSIQKSDNRPIIGKISINSQKLQIKKNNIEKHTNILLHETMHILAFSPKIFENFKNQPAQKELQTQNTLKTPKLLETAKRHFNCDSLKGVPLETENLSSKGIHFEKQKMGNELMTSNLSEFPALSKMTLAFLEDSGWYKVDYTYSDKFYWGEKKGCDFLEIFCDGKFREFCEKEEEDMEVCSVDYRKKSVCTEFDGCFFNEAREFMDCTKNSFFRKGFGFEENGVGSRCFRVREAGRGFSACFKVGCVNGGLDVFVGNEVFFCREKGDVLGFNKDFEIVCPDVEDFCRKFFSNCFDDCSGNGSCLVDNSCYCDYFYSGFKCQNVVGCKLEDKDICDSLKLNSYDDEIVEKYDGIFIIYLFFIFISI